MTGTSPTVRQRNRGKQLLEPHGHNNLATPITIQKALERLRQERETFDQKKFQDARWFILKMAMGVVAVLVMPALIVISVLIIADPHQDATVKWLASTALLVDILGLVGAVWKVILNPATLTQLAPVTDACVDSSTIVEQNQQPDPQAMNPIAESHLDTNCIAYDDSD